MGWYGSLRADSTVPVDGLFMETDEWRLCFESCQD